MTGTRNGYLRASSRNAAATRLRVWPLLEAGLYPIPVHPQTRRPLVPWGELDRLGHRPGIGEARTGTLAGGPAGPWVPLVFEWWDRWPAAGAAILTGLSRLLVVDVDPRHGGHHTLARLVADRPLPATRTVRTRSGGLHLYYRTATLVKSDAGALGAGVDVKSCRGLAYSPPTPGYTLLERRPVAEAPGWLVARCGRPARGGRRRGERYPFDDPKAQHAVQHAVQRILDAPPGERHLTIYGQARYAYKHCLDDRVTEVLHAAADRVTAGASRRKWERAIADARRKEGGR